MHQNVPACGCEQIAFALFTILTPSGCFLIFMRTFLLVLQEANLMANFGLSPGTLKGELFSILLNQGSNGMKVSELVNLPSVS